jgi:hypothetical protein
VTVGRVSPLVSYTCAETMTSSLVHINRRSIDKSTSQKIVIMLVQEVSFSELELRLGGSEERTQLVSNKSPETKILCSSDASASDLAQSCLSFSSEMLEDVLDHKVEHMRNRPGNPEKITVGSANHITLYEHVYMMSPVTCLYRCAAPRNALPGKIKCAFSTP